MVDIKIHKNENNQLLSIKGIDYDYNSKLYLLGLLKELSQLTEHTLVRVRRNNYQDPSIDKLKSIDDSSGVSDLRIRDNLFEISFHYDKNESRNEIHWILIDLWFAFQQPVYCFFSKKEAFKANHEILLKEKLYLISDPTSRLLKYPCDSANEGSYLS